MGICLDTEQKNEEFEEGDEQSRQNSAWPATPSGVAFPMQNSSHVKFEPPSVPVIFVLGGPGSGKVTHCDTLAHERRGAVHVNMTDLLQQYAIGNDSPCHTLFESAYLLDMQDFGTLSSKTVTEVLMLEMKMAPTAKTYLVSGYPRSMRDVAEYSDKIQTISGVVLVSWRQRVLERQIEYGARLGHVVLSLARMELNNFYKNVIPVADYFDQSNMLIAVNGERNPEEVYKDFRAAVLQILGAVEEQNMNGVGVGAHEEVYKDFRAAVLQILGAVEEQNMNGVGVGAHAIPGEVVGVEPVPTRNYNGKITSQDVEIEDEPFTSTIAPTIPTIPVHVEPVPKAASLPVTKLPRVMPVNGRVVSPKPEVIQVRGTPTIPPTLWVVGGPGSNKAALCEGSVLQRDGWTHFSLGQRLRALADTGGGPASDGAIARTAVSGGELVPQDLVTKLVITAVNDAARSGHGIVLDGYPRDLEQMEQFENEFQIEPRMVLLDCSKLQLGRGRRDDSVAAFRRRLEVFRELSLPMLKSLDQQHRLVIVDGDTDSSDVQSEFTRVLLEEMEKAEAIAAIPQPQIPDIDSQTQILTTHHSTRDDAVVQQFAHSVSRIGAGIANGVQRNGTLPNGVVGNGAVGNGFINMANNKVKPMLNNIPKVPTVSQMTHDQVRRLYEQSSGEITMNTHM
ncbi:jg4704 [Pararge aegeria aegeria]|uniref:Jg4704 protein n=1 Tax=Pararge aegeria aegeria TaxID=348720 RepID=A0A8S4RBW1_9NEOP|nr:jg4704 [Pararge aegeria aegeria]